MSACGKNNFLLWGFLYRSDVTIHSLVVVILIGAVGFLLLDVTDVVLHTLEVFLFVSLLGAANGRQTLFVLEVLVLAVLIVDVTIVHGVLHAVVIVVVVHAVVVVVVVYAVVVVVVVHAVVVIDVVIVHTVVVLIVDHVAIVGKVADGRLFNALILRGAS